MTPHITAKAGEIAETILLPGDPLRAKYIAENFLQNPVQFNQVRNMFGYTGTYNAKPVSVMGTGMGMPSISIYVNELILKYGCKNLIRVGTCGAMQENVKIRDVILAQAASTDSHINRLRFQGQDFAAIANFDLLYRAYNATKAAGMSVHVGNILSSDTFYHDDPDSYKLWARFGVLAVEMEAAALYTLAAKYGVNALCILTVSDHLVYHQETTVEERQLTFNQMIEVALEAATA